VEERLALLKNEEEAEAPALDSEKVIEAEIETEIQGASAKEQVESPEQQAGLAVSEAYTSRDEAGRLDLNRATAAELDELKGIGPSKAQAIIEDRERNGFFASVEDLLRVKGIGEKLLAGIKESVVTRP